MITLTNMISFKAPKKYDINPTFSHMTGWYDMLQTLRKAGGSLVMTIPKSFIEQNGLSEGSQVDLQFSGRKMTIEAPMRPAYKLVDLMAEMKEGLPMVDGWDKLPDVGLENT